MKVSSSGKVSRPALGRAKATSKGSGASFSVQISASESAPATTVGRAGPIAAVDALLGLQEVPHTLTPDEREVARGHDILDQLEEIRRGLLLGMIPVGRLKALASRIGEQRATLRDPRLVAILDEIELRARVELAKMEYS